MIPAKTPNSLKERIKGKKYKETKLKWKNKKKKGTKENKEKRKKDEKRKKWPYKVWNRTDKVYSKPGTLKIELIDLLSALF